MTFEQFLARQKANNFRCRGYLTQEARARITWLRENGYDDASVLVDDANRGLREGEPFVKFVEPRSVGGRVALVSHWSDGRVTPWVARPLCGYEFFETMKDGPWDGEEHEYTCPRCGVTGIYYPALYVPE